MGLKERLLRLDRFHARHGAGDYAIFLYEVSDNARYNASGDNFPEDLWAELFRMAVPYHRVSRDLRHGDTLTATFTITMD